MPKRRLSYGEVVNGVKTPPPSLGRDISLQIVDTTSSASRKKSSDVLIKLSHSCNAHSNNCHRDRNIVVNVDNEAEDIPEQCRVDLEKLRNLLPEIEKKFQPPAYGDKGPEANDVAHLCDFYNSAMQGSYCPYAPHLFHRGKSPDSVMWRVAFLFRHLVTAAVIVTAKKASKSIDSTTETSETVISIISRTIAHFLSFLVGSSVRSYIFTDLVKLLGDCCSLFDSNCLPVRLILFEETCQILSIDVECSLEILHRDQLCSLQTATMMVMGTYLVDAQERRLRSHPSTTPGTTPSGSDMSRTLIASGWVDLHFCIPDQSLQNEIQATTLSSIRSVLLMEDHRDVSDTQVAQAKLAAANMLKQILSDWSRLPPSISAFTECSLVVVQAIGKAIVYPFGGRPAYVKILSDLLRRVVMDPPVLAGQPFSIEKGLAVGKHLLPVLLDCVEGINKKKADSRDTVDALVLMSIHFLVQHENLNATLSAYCLSSGVIPHLLGLLHDPRFANHVAAVLVILLQRISKPHEINALYNAALENKEKTRCGNATDAVPEVSDDHVDDSTPMCRNSKRERDEFVFRVSSPSPILGLSSGKGKCDGHFLLSANNSEATLSYWSWAVSLRQTVLTSLRAARRVAFDFDNFASLSSHQTTRILDESFLYDTYVIATTLRLTCRIISKCMGEGFKKESISSTFDVCQRLLEAMDLLCRHLSHHGVDFFGKTDYVFPQIIVDCALDLHYSAGKLMSEPQHICFRKMVELTLATSTISRKWLFDDDFCVTRARHSFQGCEFPSETSLINVLSLQAVQTHDGATEGFSAWRTAVLSSHSQHECDLFVHVASLEIVHALPLGARCCWLLSLYPAGCILSDQLHLHEGGLRLDAVFTDVSTKYSVSVLLLLFLPQYLSSVQYFMTNANDKGKFFELLLKVLTEFIVPMTGNLNQCDTIHCRLLLFAVAWIDAFVTMPLASMASMNPRFNVLTGIKIAATMDVPTIFESDHENSSLEVDIQLKKCIHILSGKIPENHPDHNVRKLRWSCMAKSVFRSSTAEIRELASDRPNDLSNDTPMRRAKTDDFRTQSYFIWLLETCFVDNDRHFREDVCHNFCRLILSNNDSYLLSHFASEKDSQILATFSRSTILGKASSQVYEVEHAAESVVSEFFRDIDKLLHTSIGVSDSQLSFTMANSGSTDISTKGKESQGNKQSMKRTALKLLATFCRRANTGTPMGRFLFEKSLQRLARIWAAANYDKVDDLSFSTSKVLAFAELSRISAQQIEGRSVWWDESPHFTATIFSDILVLNCNASREMQCLQLEGFIRTVITRDPKDPLVNHRMLKACQGFVEESLPAIVAQFIEEKSLELLRLTPAFRQFLEERIRRVRKDSSGEPRVIGGSNAPDRWKYRSVVTSIGELDKQARKLCLDHRILDRVLPMVFLSMDRTGLSFLTKEVLKGMTLTSLIKTREIMILKGLVWELGQEPESFSPARIAIRTVAAALTLDDAGGTLDIEAHRSAAADVELGKKWVTSHFMYLLVSVVQSRWKARSLRDRLHAVKCLHGMLDFLVACEAPQYFPQIMTTVNASILGGGWGNWSNDQDMLDASSLRLYAIKSLSKLIRLVAEVQLDTIAVNLTTIVVALIPVVDDDSQSYLARYDCAETRDVAVSILNFLTAGDLGCSMAVHFKEIPFLPSSQLLESVHRSLLSNGVDFDNLAILSSMSASQHGSGAKRNFPLASEFSATMGNTVSRETEKILALQNRLSLICGLLESESTSVRKVSLEHLIDLLRGNRDTFRMLVIAEGSMSEKRFLTLAYKGDGLNRKWASRGATAPMMEKLLTRCIAESDSEVRRRLATCLGEVGAISETILGDLRIGVSMGDDAIDVQTTSFRWRLEQPPWQSQAVKYELQLVTQQLVVALKAAPSSTDQHKIAFAIQQMLHLLNSFAGESEPSGPNVSSSTGKGIMTKWLKENLEQSGQYDLIEPYFSSDFKEKTAESYVSKKPPFFKISAGYFTWISSFCRWMIQGSRASDLTLNGWRDFFFACRTAIRTEAGLNVAEFIIPLLVLDRICFGTSEERLLIYRELAEILEVKTTVFMDNTDRQKAVNLVFTIMDTLRIWSEREVEERSRGRSLTIVSGRNRRHASNKSTTNPVSQSWPAEDSIERIAELLAKIPLNLQAEAAQVFGMNALALQRLEFKAREDAMLEIFEKSVEDQKTDASEGRLLGSHNLTDPTGESINIEAMKNVLSRLDDCETMAAIGQDALNFEPLQQLRDSIREKLSSDDYELALQEFERALQASTTDDRDPSVVEGLLRCLMQLGRYESVLNQVGGLQRNKKSDGSDETFSFAVEAAWKLGNWKSLSDFLEESKGVMKDSSGAYQVALGRAILGIHRQDYSSVDAAIKIARENVMQNLSSAARESYGRSYDDIVNLHTLRELENAKELLSLADQDHNSVLAEVAYSTAMDGWSWKGRLDVATSRGALAISCTRIALARLSSDPVLVGLLFLESGHIARKNQRWTISENLLLQAQATVAGLKRKESAGDPKLVHLVYSSQIQLAKLKFSSGECAVALKILGQRTVDRVVVEMLPNMDNPDILAKLATNCEKKLVLECSEMLEQGDLKIVNRFARRLLQLTRWASDVGLKGTSEILDRFQLIQKLAPDWEKGYFYFGKFVDTILQARMTAMVSGGAGRDLSNGVDENEIRSDILLRDQICQSHTLLAMRMYASALKIDTKHVYQALPRLLSLWFDLVSVARDHDAGELGSRQDALHMLRHNQNQANTFMASQVRDIPPVSFYTTMPQLIARVIHDDPETSMVVKSILQRVLVKFPQQAMWPLAWLQGSKIPDRAGIGDEIFHGAQKALAKNHRAMSNLIKVSKNLFEYLRNLAVYNQGSSERSNMLNLRPWQHPEVDLAEFIPPIQAALAITPTSIDHANAKDHFARTIPRMRAFSSRVGVMTSKAKPKKLRAYAVPGSYKVPRTSQSASSKSRSSEDVDIGELHFLVKQEAKGDLRKDARVQDLNNVINRLMSANSGESGVSSRRRRRLHLRTFAVTCLSEDIGILEWVPDTDSLRNLVTKSYNPQTSATCIRRRGSRLANFGDATLRSNYEMCQNKFFKEGNLAKAASLFEDQCLRPYPPLLFWWFVQKFQSPHAWYEARNRFTLSSAAWSAVGHVIGLGDRHSENILVDTSSGECVHVDFDCIFDKGLNLPRPEVVPFRLTANMVDAFGPTGADGVYTAGLQTAMRTLRDNRDTLLSVLEPFLKDPVIDWKRHRGQQKPQSGTALVVHTEKQTEEAKRSIKVIDERLQGIYNLRNPNLKKYRRREQSTDQDDEFGHLVPLPVEGQVQRMIKEATSNENLVQLYVGWMPWV